MKNYEKFKQNVHENIGKLSRDIEEEWIFKKFNIDNLNN